MYWSCTYMLHTKICELKCWDHVHAKLIYRCWSYVYPILWMCFNHVNKLCANGYPAEMSRARCYHGKFNISMSKKYFIFNIPCLRLEYFYSKRFYNFPSEKFFVYWKKKKIPKFQHFWNNVINVETWSLHMQTYTWIHMLRSYMCKFYRCMCWCTHTQLCECILYHVCRLCVNGCTS